MITVGGAVATLRLQIHLQPRAGHDRIVGRHGDAIKVQVRAPPVGGAANTALIELLACTLAVPRRSIRIVRGHTSRLKVVEVVSSDSASCRRRLQEAIGPCVDKSGAAG